MKKKLFALLVTSLVLLSNSAFADEKDTLIVAQAAEAKTMDPVASNDVPSHRVFLNIYDTLIQRDQEGKLVPALADSWEQVDPLTLVLKLKKGIKFHNGNDFKANDVVFSLTRAKEAPALMSFFGDIDKVEAVDDYTVKITTKQPFGPLINYLSHKGSCILDEETVKAAGEDYALHPVGTGPYEFVSWRSGDRITLKANPNYFGGKPVTENLVFRVITEATNRTIALETKEVDIAYEIDPIDIQFIKAHPYQASSVVNTLVGLLEQHGKTWTLIPNDDPFEQIHLSVENLCVFGTESSLMFYATLLGNNNKIISNRNNLAFNDIIFRKYAQNSESLVVNSYIQI